MLKFGMQSWLEDFVGWDVSWFAAQIPRKSAGTSRVRSRNSGRISPRPRPLFAIRCAGVPNGGGMSLLARTDVWLLTGFAGRKYGTVHSRCATDGLNTPTRARSFNLSDKRGPRSGPHHDDWLRGAQPFPRLNGIDVIRWSACCMPLLVKRSCRLVPSSSLWQQIYENRLVTIQSLHSNVAFRNGLCPCSHLARVRHVNLFAGTSRQSTMSTMPTNSRVAIPRQASIMSRTRPRWLQIADRAVPHQIISSRTPLRSSRVTI